MNIIEKIKAWRSKKYPKAVVSHACLSKIPVRFHSHFIECEDEPTAQIAYGPNPGTFAMSMLLDEMNDASLSQMTVGDDFQGFGGGTTGGGGASGHWTPEMPQPQEYIPSTPDYDPGASPSLDTPMDFTPSDSSYNGSDSTSYGSNSSDSSSSSSSSDSSYSSSDSGSSYDSGSSDSGSSSSDN